MQTFSLKILIRRIPASAVMPQKTPANPSLKLRFTNYTRAVRRTSELTALSLRLLEEPATYRLEQPNANPSLKLRFTSYTRAVRRTSGLTPQKI